MQKAGYALKGEEASFDLRLNMLDDEEEKSIVP